MQALLAIIYFFPDYLPYIRKIYNSEPCKSRPFLIILKENQFFTLPITKKQKAYVR